jgi:hypothetical protein
MFIDPEEIINVIVHVVFISSFIGIFFFTYGKTVEKNIVETQTKNTIKAFGTDFSLFLTPEQKAKMKILTDATLEAPDMQKQDDAAEEKNAKLVKLAGKAIGILFAVAVAIIAAIVYFTEVSFKDLGNILLKNGIILLFVALTEFSFLTYVAQNYTEIDPNYIKYKMVKSLNDYANN